MRGLLYHDFQLTRRTIATLLALLVIFDVLSLRPFLRISPLPLIFLYTGVSKTLFTHDDKDGWNRYAFSLPSGRRAALRARYLLVSGALAAGTAIQLGFLLFLSRMPSADLYASLMVQVYGLFLVLLLFCLDMTLTYYFGVGPSPNISTVLIFLFFLAMAPLSQLLLEELPLQTLKTMLALILCPIAPAAVYLSYRISLRAVCKRNF